MSIVTNLNSSTAQEIVNWVMTACRQVRSHRQGADTTQPDFAVDKFVQTRRDCRQLVAIVYTPPTRLNSTVQLRGQCVCYWAKGNTPNAPNFSRNKSGVHVYRKIGTGRTKPAISPKRLKIQRNLLGMPVYSGVRQVCRYTTL